MRWFHSLVAFGVVAAATVVATGALAASSQGLKEAAHLTPTAPYLEQASAGDTRIDLVWSEATDTNQAAASFEVWRGTSAGRESNLTSGPCAQPTGSARECVDTGLANGQAYFYKVRAVNSVGWSDFSNERSATPVAGAVLTRSVQASAPTRSDPAGPAPTIAPSKGVGSTGAADALGGDAADVESADVPHGGSKDVSRGPPVPVALVAVPLVALVALAWAYLARRP